MPLQEYCAGASCEAQIARAIGLLAGRWAVPVLEALYFSQSGLSQFREMQRRVAGISQKELSKQLRAFVHHGIVHRIAPPERPVRVSYELTSKGHALMAHLDALGQWVGRRVDAAPPKPAPEPEPGPARATTALRWP